MSLILDYTHSLAGSIGATHGLTDAEVDTLVAKFPKYHEAIEELRSTGESAFFDMPYQDTKPVKELLKAHKGKWDAVVVVGMGGAAITPLTLVHSLLHEQWNQLPSKARKGGPLVFAIDNLDPKSINDLCEVIDPKKTLFLVVSRSGNTAETNAIYIWLEAWLRKKSGKDAVTKQVLGFTDPSSPLAAALGSAKASIIPLPGNLQDRMAWLGPHSLLLAGLCNLDVDALISGAADMDKRCRHDRAVENPAYMHSLIQYLLTRKRRKTIHAMMTFSRRLATVSDWYSHNLSVSLGKMLNRKGKAVHVGPGPAYCWGATGCYGQMQLFQEGPFDKVTTFITTKDHGVAMEVPNAHAKVDGLSYLAGKDIAAIIDAGFTTAAQVITAAGRPNMTITLDAIDEATISGLYYLLSLSAVMSAELYGIDPFNQPGVDSNKQAVFAQLGRVGFEDKAHTLEAFKVTERKTC
ncbi:MAG: hypothetical protein EA402_04305 [Planctomycetota bacterium]|nr:MAG: hypothetical protein EA402_04305 [Planctomycetota bacterium]